MTPAIAKKRHVAIVGARSPIDWATEGQEWVRLCAYLETFVATLPLDALVVSGGADGIDSLAVNKARCRGIECVEFFPNYRLGPKAPLLRNTQIVQHSTEIHAFPASWSRGTWDTVRKAREAGVPCEVHGPGKGRKL